MKILLVGEIKAEHLTDFSSKIKALQEKHSFDCIVIGGNIPNSDIFLQMDYNIYYFDQNAKMTNLNWKLIHLNSTIYLQDLVFGYFESPEKIPALDCLFLNHTYTELPICEKPPRYCISFSSLDEYKEPAPFNIHSDYPTRLIQLAHYGGEQKHLYALQLVPLTVKRKEIEENENDENYQEKKFKYICKICSEPGHLIQNCPKKNLPPADYLCKICQQPGHYIRNCPKKLQNQMPAPIPQEECWFCLSNPKITQHMIASIGNEFYLSLPKGELVTNHLLLVPIEHLPCSLAWTDSHLLEFKKYQASLQLWLQQTHPNQVWFMFETFAPHMQHGHLQMLPLEKSNVEAFKKVLENNLKLQIHNKAKFQSFSKQKPNFTQGYLRYFVLNEEGDDSICWLPLKKFDFQFFRKSLAEFLKIKERADWKKCQQSEEEEEKAARTFKESFSPFDFTLASE